MGQTLVSEIFFYLKISYTKIFGLENFRIYGSMY